MTHMSHGMQWRAAESRGMKRQVTSYRRILRRVASCRGILRHVAASCIEILCHDMPCRAGSGRRPEDSMFIHLLSDLPRLYTLTTSAPFDTATLTESRGALAIVSAESYASFKNAS
ncbi:unnamed protein product [Pieris brassicae]|uniref:Uncharacterized protein n=1 Tax=Pieris brassicae TaxID=7116 RepID=A0A9P0TRG7_PIEBR|nr:unnamed protein product [Pieris brassicae]